MRCDLLWGVLAQKESFLPPGRTKTQTTSRPRPAARPRPDPERDPEPEVEKETETDLERESNELRDMLRAQSHGGGSSVCYELPSGVLHRIVFLDLRRTKHIQTHLGLFGYHN